jgi:hypothetical protein
MLLDTIPQQGYAGVCVLILPAEYKNLTLFSPPEDCPNWSCICKDQPAGALLPAPDNECSAYITCGAEGTGVKGFCAIAGTGFNPATRICDTLAAPESDKICNFARVDSTTPPADGEECCCLSVLKSITWK